MTEHGEIHNMGEPGPSLWAQAKIARARQHGMELDGRVALWASMSHLRPESSISDDRMAWSVRLRVGSPPPLQEWALIVGDAIHNLRSALDVLVWAHADPSALSADEQRRLYFPILVDEAQWPAVSRDNLKTLPSPTVAAIKEVQPFNRPEADRAKDGLLLLHALDIRDKHRLALATMAALREATHDHSVEFKDEEAAQRNVPPDVTVHVASLDDGALMLEGRTKDPIEKLTGALMLNYQLGLEIDGNFVGMHELLKGLDSLVTQVVTHVTNATAAAAQAEEELRSAGTSAVPPQDGEFTDREAGEEEAG